MRIHLIAATLALSLSPFAHAAPEAHAAQKAKPAFVVLGPQGQLSRVQGSEALGGTSLAIHGLGWSYAAQGQAKNVRSRIEGEQRIFEGALEVPGSGGKLMQFRQTVRASGDREMILSYRLHFPEAVPLFGYQIFFNVKAPRVAGQPLELRGKSTSRLNFPVERGGAQIWSGAVRELQVGGDHPEGFTLSLNADTPLLVQDNRAHGSDDIELRFNFRRQEAGDTVPAGETVERTFTVRYNSPTRVLLDEEAHPDSNDTTGWIPFVLPWDSSPLDVSFLNEKPAGKRGFVQVKGDRFVFGDGTEAKFWGTCFSAGANFPTHEQSEKIAKRLAAFGVNIVRTHHADAAWAENHFFDKTRNDTQHFDKENLDRFDYLIYCLKREGIYVYLDQLVNRKFKPGDNVDAVEELGVCGKPYSNFDPRLIELQKKFSHDLWTHVNPYTKLAYKDDPAIAMMEFANENDLFSQRVTLEPYRTRLEQRYREWAKKNGVTVGPEPVNFTRYTTPITRFLEEVQRDYYREMGAYIRSIGVRVPTTGSNWSRNAALLSSISVTDFTDSHSYWDHPSGDYRGFHNRPMVASLRNVFDSLSFNRLAGKPFFVSEWDQPWPNEWRAEHPLAMAAVAAFQSWNGLTVYTYRHSSRVPVDTLSGAFETFNDPARFGLFYHAALIYRRGDVRPAQETVTVCLPENEVLGEPNRTPWNVSALAGVPEVNRVQMALMQPPAGAKRVLGPNENGVPQNTQRLVSDTGELRRDMKQRVGMIETARTQAVYGFTGEAGTLRLRDLEVTSRTPFGTVAVSSITDQPIASSRRLFLTAVGRAENTDMRYNILRTRRLNTGKGPILVEPIEAEVRLRASRTLTVRPVLADGTRGQALPAQYRDGWLSFTIGASSKTIYYEIGDGR